MLTHIHPSRCRFTCRTRPIFNGAADPARSPGPAKARQVPRAPLLARGVTSHNVASRTPSEGITPLSSLLLAHAPDQIPPTVLVLLLINESLQVVTSPCWELVLPSVISANLSPDACTHTPVVLLVPIPVSSQETSAFVTSGPTRHFTKISIQRLPYGRFLGAAVIPLCSGLQVCSPPRSLLPQHTLTAHWAAMAFTSPHISVCYLPEQGIC